MSEDQINIVTLHQENLQRTIDFLKFAEAKNGAAIAFASALVLSTMQARGQLSDLRLHETVGLCVALLGGLVSARSFLPQLSWKKTKKNPGCSQTNLLFFGDIAKLSAEDFQSSFSSRYVNGSEALEHDLSVQTVANSRIAVDKMKHFSLATMLLVLSVFILAISIVIETCRYM